MAAAETHVLRGGPVSRCCFVTTRIQLESSKKVEAAAALSERHHGDNGALHFHSCRRSPAAESGSGVLPMPHTVRVWVVCSRLLAAAVSAMMDAHPGAGAASLRPRLPAEREAAMAAAVSASAALPALCQAAFHHRVPDTDHLILHPHSTPLVSHHRPLSQLSSLNHPPPVTVPSPASCCLCVAACRCL